MIHEVPRLPERQREDVLADVHAADEVGDPEEAIVVLEEARRSIADPDLDEMLVERYLELPTAQAEKRLRVWWEREHDRYGGAGLARILIDRNCRVEALTVLTESKGETAASDYWRLLALLHDEKGDIDAAVAAMELHARLNPDDADAWIALAEMQQRLDQTDRALLSLRRAGDAVPDSILPRILRLRILIENTRWREARDLAEALLEGHYADAGPAVLHELRDMLAGAYYELGDFDAARHLWQSLLAESPRDAEIAHQLATLEVMTKRYRHALLVLDASACGRNEVRILDLHLRSLLGLHEYEEAEALAREIEEIEPDARVLSLVQAIEATSRKEYAWSIQLLESQPADRYADLWSNLRLDCLAHLARWQDLLPALKSLVQPDDRVLIRAALSALACNKLDIAERLLGEVQDHHSTDARSLAALLGPLRQGRRAAEARRQQQVDEAERQRRAAESRELRRRARDLELHNAALADALARAEASLERLLELVGVSAEGGIPPDWEDQLQRIAERSHKDALEHELEQAERRLKTMLGERCWKRLPDSARTSLREGEWLFVALDGEDRDYGASLLEYARGLERAFKDAIFVQARSLWERHPGPIDRLQDEGHDPSLGPFVRYILQASHLTLGSMAAALDRMGDLRRQGVAIGLLRRQLGIDPHDERTLEDWKHVAERLADAADARNQPAHAGAVSRDAVVKFREMVLGVDGLLRALDLC